MDDQTVPPFKTEEPQSKIFNTSVRGWIAIVLSVTLGICVLLTFIAPFVGVTMPDNLSNQLMTLFASGLGGALGLYFNMKSNEGQKK